jgi:hypothetical protein
MDTHFDRRISPFLANISSRTSVCASEDSVHSVNGSVSASASGGQTDNLALDKTRINDLFGRSSFVTVNTPQAASTDEQHACEDFKFTDDDVDDDLIYPSAHKPPSVLQVFTLLKESLSQRGKLQHIQDLNKDRKEDDFILKEMMNSVNVAEYRQAVESVLSSRFERSTRDKRRAPIEIAVTSSRFVYPHARSQA